MAATVTDDGRLKVEGRTIDGVTLLGKPLAAAGVAPMVKPPWFSFSRLSSITLDFMPRFVAFTSESSPATRPCPMAEFIVSKMFSSLSATDDVVVRSRRRARRLDTDGTFEGSDDGAAVTVGIAVGRSDGINDGGKDIVGTGVGTTVGATVIVGSGVGALLGSTDALRIPPSIKLEMAFKLDDAAASLRHCGDAAYCGPGGEGGESPQGITSNHRRTTNPLTHVGHKLIAPQGAPIVQLCRLGTPTESQQIDGVHGMGLSQHGNVVPPVICGGPEPMHQQKGRAISKGVRLLLHRMNGVAEMVPGRGLHNVEQEPRC